MKFSLEPPPGQSAFEQWKDAMKAVGRLPMGIPPEFRRKVSKAALLRAFRLCTACTACDDARL